MKAGLCIVEMKVLTKKGLNPNFHRTIEEMRQDYYQKFWMNVFAVFEHSGRDTIHVSVEKEVDDLVVRPSLQEWGHGEPWWKDFVQPGGR